MFSTNFSKVFFLPVRLKLMCFQRKVYHNKQVRCKFCETDQTSRNFVRHLIRHHGTEKEVKDALEFPLKSKERRQAIELIKGSTNFDLYLKGIVRPKKERDEMKEAEYYPCIYCKTLYSKRYLSRHTKICPTKKYSVEAHIHSKPITLSQTAVACALDTTDVISKLNIKEQVTLSFDNFYNFKIFSHQLIFL